MSKKPCMVKGCEYPKKPGKHKCRWHWLLAQPIEAQIRAAENRREYQLGQDFVEYVARIPKEEWPPGERWCAGCQHYVPLFYCTGSRCKACASKSAHSGRVEREYGISREDYEDLLRWQGGRCYICRRQPKTKRLAVDHDHRTGEVRGLLCANNENGCNRAVIANLEAAVDGGLPAARRAVEYLEHPPFARMRGQEPREGGVQGLREAPAPDRTPPPF